MDDKYRFLTTAIIWVMVGVILLGMFAAVAMAGSVPTWVGGGVFAFAFTLIIIAGVSTHTIWRTGYDVQKVDRIVSQPAEKGKRVDSGLLARLVDDLSPNEVVELETLLLARDDWGDGREQTE